MGNVFNCSTVCMQDVWWKAVKPLMKTTSSMEEYLEIARDHAQGFVKNKVG